MDFCEPSNPESFFSQYSQPRIESLIPTKNNSNSTHSLPVFTDGVLKKEAESEKNLTNDEFDGSFDIYRNGNVICMYTLKIYF